MVKTQTVTGILWSEQSWAPSSSGWAWASLLLAMLTGLSFILYIYVSYVVPHILNVSNLTHVTSIKNTYSADATCSRMECKRNSSARVPESSGNREDRLQRRRERERACRASETTEQREEWLRVQRARDRARRAAQTAEERAARLQQMSANQRYRLASETEEERAARLQWMSANQRHRLASETEEERAARLQQMSANQCKQGEWDRWVHPPRGPSWGSDWKIQNANVLNNDIIPIHTCTLIVFCVVSNYKPTYSHIISHVV